MVSKNNPNPTGAQMLARQLRIKDMTLDALREYPQGRGDDMLLYVHILRKHYWRMVHVQTKPRLIIDYGAFENFLMTPSFETVRRRRQEWQAKYEELRPSIRVRHKRQRLQDAMTHDLSTGQYTVADFMG